MKNLLIISLFTMLWACNTQYKAEKFYTKHPQKLADKCASTFPVRDSIFVKDSISFDTLYLEQQPIVLKDSFFIKGDTVLRTITKQCPPATSLIKTIRHDSIVIRPDMAKEASLQYQIEDLKKLVADYVQTIQDKNKEIIAAKNQTKRQNKRLLLILLLLALETVWILRKPLKLFV